MCYYYFCITTVTTMNSLKNRLLYVIVLNYAGPYSPNGLLIFGYIWVVQNLPPILKNQFHGIFV